MRWRSTKPLETGEWELDLAKRELETKTFALKEESGKNIRLEVKVGTVRAAIGGCKRLIYYLSERVFNSYASLVCVLAASYRDRPHTVRADVHACGEILAASLCE